MREQKIQGALWATGTSQSGSEAALRSVSGTGCVPEPCVKLRPRKATHIPQLTMVDRTESGCRGVVEPPITDGGAEVAGPLRCPWPCCPCSCSRCDSGSPSCWASVPCSTALRMMRDAREPGAGQEHSTRRRLDRGAVTVGQHATTVRPWCSNKWAEVASVEKQQRGTGGQRCAFTRRNTRDAREPEEREEDGSNMVRFYGNEWRRWSVMCLRRWPEIPMQGALQRQLSQRRLRSVNYLAYNTCWFVAPDGIRTQEFSWPTCVAVLQHDPGLVGEAVRLAGRQRGGGHGAAALGLRLVVGSGWWLIKYTHL